MTILVMTDDIHKKMWEHLLPRRAKYENAAFMFTDSTEVDGQVRLEYKDWYPVQPTGFVIQSEGHIELTDQTRATVIKRAHDLKACLVEFHSHLYSYEAGFSWSDISGLKEFVPHVMWRLKGRPYAAVVVGQTSFDALVWSVGATAPETLSEVCVGKHVLHPTGATLREGGFL
jgi:hypothetical protein